MDRKIIASTVAATVVAIPAFAAVAYAATTPESITPATTTTATSTVPAPRTVVKAKPAKAKAKAKAPYKFGSKKYNKWYAKGYMKKKYGWGDAQYRAVVTIFEHESGWSHHAQNSSSGAYGIPQSLPGSKMRTSGKDWRTNPETQIRWGLKYIHGSYGTPTRAWAFWQSHNWY
ncbi:MAG: transglycosylase SLT domain-containing protein [Candidatus Nanopelagicales bacterium]